MIKCTSDQLNSQVCAANYIETCGYDKDKKFVKTYSNECVACGASKESILYYKLKGNGKCESVNQPDSQLKPR